MNTKGKAKKSDTPQQERDYINLTSFEVKNVRVVEGKKGDIVFLTLILNGVTLYNCRVATGKAGDFISFPQYKGTDGNYYNSAYAALSDEASKTILEKIQEIIDNM